MRLIDADALMKEFAEFVKESNNSDFADVPTWNDAVSLLGSAPDLKAIPIQWIHDYLDYTFLPESHFWVIQKMIKEWNKEYEKDI